MEAVDLHAEAWAGIRNGLESGRIAHAYILAGSPRGDALQFAEAMLKLLFCESTHAPCNECVSCRQVEAHKYVDIVWIEPQSRSRQIKAEEVRALVRQMTQTSFGGGWKAAVILAADCMNTTSANILLKTLEEPPPRTLLLLVTQSPQSLLPTIVSRCQKIVMSAGSAGPADGGWKRSLMDILCELPPVDGLSAARFASQLKGLLDGIQAEISDAVESELDLSDETIDGTKLKETLAARTNARLREVQSDVFRIMQEWHRDILLIASGVDEQHLNFSDSRDVLINQAGKHTKGSALLSIQIIEGMAQRMERNIPSLQVLDEAFRGLVRR